MFEKVSRSLKYNSKYYFCPQTSIYVTGSGKRGHFAQKLKNELLTWCYSAYLASQNGTYHRAWSPTIAELHALVLSHLQENFNYCIIRKHRFFFKLPVQYARYLPVYAYQLTTRTRCRFFFPEWVSVFKPRACLLRVASGASNFAWRERPNTKVTPEVKKFFLSNTNYFLYSTKNGHSEKSSAARSAPFSQSLSHIYIWTPTPITLPRSRCTCECND